MLALLEILLGYIRVGRGLQGANACGQHKDRGQEQGKADEVGRRNEQQRAHHHDEERNDHGALVAHGLNQLGARYREDQVSEEPRRRDQHGRSVGEIEERFQVRHQVAVQVGEEPEDAEQDGDGDERNNVAGRAGRCRRCGSCSHESLSPRFLQRKSLVSAVFQIDALLDAAYASGAAGKDSQWKTALQSTDTTVSTGVEVRPAETEKVFKSSAFFAEGSLLLSLGLSPMLDGWNYSPMTSLPV
jgi:hypothetical protein